MLTYAEIEKIECVDTLVTLANTEGRKDEMLRRELEQTRVKLSELEAREQSLLNELPSPFNPFRPTDAIARRIGELVLKKAASK